MKSTPHQDIVIIGSGIGGLTAGALLARSGRRVLILEKNHLPGGCCSTFTRQEFRFEAGATTLMGFDQFQPLGRLEREIGLQLDKIRLTPPMTVWLDDQPIVRHENLTDWISEASSVFGPEGQDAFWQLCYQVAQDAWEISYSMPYFPPGNLHDWLMLSKPDNWRFLKSFPWVMRSTAQVIRNLGLADNEKFMRFINQQMLIASQAYSADTQFLVGAPVLTYTNSPNYYLSGGLIQLPDQLISIIRENGGAIHYRKEVSKVKRTTSGFELTCTDGSLYQTRKLISNTTIWNMQDLMKGTQTDYFKDLSDRFSFGWGAFILNLGIRDRFPVLDSLHHQLIFKTPLPWLESTSVFLSASHPADESRAPDGYRAISISTHDPHPEVWFSLNPAEYQRRKTDIISAIRDRLSQVLPLGPDDIRVEFSSTAKTFEEWIGRKYGRVGGIPAAGLKTIFRMASPRTPDDHLYLVGDTTFPGQGISAVAQSGINTFLRVISD
ncbi:MAG: FAD-dependent oxidoreductase [Bacteroidetes bacterium]|nr:FAD-dependent oxidoreductase [Bacteroidota bacterium]